MIVPDEAAKERVCETRNSSSVVGDYNPAVTVPNATLKALDVARPARWRASLKPLNAGAQKRHGWMKWEFRQTSRLIGIDVSFRIEI
jgi:hypothetical protein